MAHAVNAAVNSTGWRHNHSHNSLTHFLKTQETRLSCIEPVWIGSPSPNVGFTGCLSINIERKEAKNVNQWSFSYGENRFRLFLVRSGVNSIKLLQVLLLFSDTKTIATLVTYTCRSIIKLIPGVFTFWSEKSFCFADMNFTDSVTILQANWFRVGSLARWASLYFIQS